MLVLLFYENGEYDEPDYQCNHSYCELQRIPMD